MEKAGIPFPKTWDELMAAGKTFESKLGKQYYPVVLEHQDVLALLNSYMVQNTISRPSMRKGEILLQQSAVGGFLRYV